jgi:hypothetical protein
MQCIFIFSQYSIQSIQHDFTVIILHFRMKWCRSFAIFKIEMLFLQKTCHAFQQHITYYFHSHAEARYVNQELPLSLGGRYERPDFAGPGLQYTWRYLQLMHNGRKVQLLRAQDRDLFALHGRE